MSEKVLLIVVLLQGWTESGALKESLLKKVLESIPGVKVIVPDYLELTARGKFTKFRTHQTIEKYADMAEFLIQSAIRRDGHQNIPMLVVGHSLGGIIARILCARGLFPAENMILVGTPNKGITYRTTGGSFGIIIMPILKILANKRICDVPVLFQLLEGSDFLNKLNENGIPREAFYISGAHDKTVPLWSNDPHNIGAYAECGHHLLPNEGLLAERSAVPIIVELVKGRLA